MTNKDDDGFVGRVGDYLVALTQDDIELMRNRFEMPQHLKDSLNDADETLTIVHCCGARRVHFLAYSNGAFGLHVFPLHDVARYVESFFNQVEED